MTVEAEPDEATMRTILERDPGQTCRSLGRSGTRCGVRCGEVPATPRDWFRDPERGWRCPRVSRTPPKVHLLVPRDPDGRRTDFVLAMGANGVNWYRRPGFPKKRVFPFAYVVEAPTAVEFPEADSHRPFRIVFVGSLIRLKRLDLLAAALKRLPRNDWAITFVGDGPMRAALESDLRDTGLSDRATFVGNLPNDAALAEVLAIRPPCLAEPDRRLGSRGERGTHERRARRLQRPLRGL